MAYAKRRGSYTRRKGKATGRRRAPTSSRKWNKSSLDKFVEGKVRKALTKSNRGPPRSVPVQLYPARFDRSTSAPGIGSLGQWTSYLTGFNSKRKYALLPLTELIPSQRPASVDADDRFRSHDSVLVKGFALRINVSYAEGARLLVFAFRNGARRETAPSPSTRPHADVAALTSEEDKMVPGARGPVSEVVYDVMSKEELMGEKTAGEFAFRNLGLQDGPFAVKRAVNGRYDWKSPDSTAFFSRFSTGEGRPVGKIYAKIDGGARKSYGRTFSKMFQSSSLMRTMAYDVQAPNFQGHVSSQTSQVELFIKLDERERFTYPHGSHSVNERPLEVFLGFDTPGPLHASEQAKEISSAAIMAMDAEVYYV